MGFDGKWNDGDYIIPEPKPHVVPEKTEPLPDIKTVALSKGQMRVTTTVEKPDGKTFTKVEIMEIDINAGINSTGMMTIRQEIVDRG